ncbi:hypothetical protein N8566_00505 [Verrucomicrobia bacterium]|nr:hypothetical protein [Verrucomicrobiota bacterium]
MKKWILSLWLLIPALVLAYHYGPGQRGLMIDEASLMVAAANHYTLQKDWPKTIELCEKTLETLPEDEVQLRRRVVLEKAKAQMMASQLPQARNALITLMDEIALDAKESDTFKDDVRQSLANSEFYMTWLMRLEGLPRSEWQPHVESARQHFKYLAESGIQGDQSEKSIQHRKDLESTVRLARMDLTELQGLPLPSQ